MAAKKTEKKTEVTTFDVQVADFIRNHKKEGTAIDDEINDQLAIPFSLDADGIDDLLHAFRMQESPLWIRMGIQVRGLCRLRKKRN